MDPQKQFQEVQGILDRLTKFRHINGWAAVAAGVLSIFAFASMNILYHIPWITDDGSAHMIIPTQRMYGYAAMLLGLLVTSVIICGLIIISSLPKDLTRTAWRNLAKLILVYGIYIVSGALVLYTIIRPAEQITLGMLRGIPAMMCIFYGLAQLHAAHFSLPALKTLGFIMLICGFMGCLFPLQAWFIWAIAFGLGHIATGFMVINARSI